MRDELLGYVMFLFLFVELKGLACSLLFAFVLFYFVDSVILVHDRFLVIMFIYVYLSLTYQPYDHNSPPFY